MNRSSDPRARSCMRDSSGTSKFCSLFSPTKQIWTVGLADRLNAAICVSQCADDFYTSHKSVSRAHTVHKQYTTILVTLTHNSLTTLHVTKKCMRKKAGCVLIYLQSQQAELFVSITPEQLQASNFLLVSQRERLKQYNTGSRKTINIRTLLGTTRLSNKLSLSFVQ